MLCSLTGPTEFLYGRKNVILLEPGKPFPHKSIYPLVSYFIDSFTVVLVAWQVRRDLWSIDI